MPQNRQEPTFAPSALNKKLERLVHVREDELKLLKKSSRTGVVFLALVVLVVFAVVALPAFISSLPKPQKQVSSKKDVKEEMVVVAEHSPMRQRSVDVVKMYEATVSPNTYQLKPFPMPDYIPSSEFSLYNDRPSFLCEHTFEVETAQALISTGRYEQINQMRGCSMVFDPIEVEEINSFGSTKQVRVITSNGQIISAYTHEDGFQNAFGYFVKYCHVAGNDNLSCINAAFDRGS